MAVAPTISLLFGKVMHKRLSPKVNGFTYGIFYLRLPLHHLPQIKSRWMLGLNRIGLFSYHDRDHGARNGQPALDWATQVLGQHQLAHAAQQIELVTLPRVLGYVFNPVSFYLCRDDKAQLRAVICEVNNTFGETHAYICRAEDGGIIQSDTIISTEKVFHVSPFLTRDGQYTFRFSPSETAFGAWIDYINPSAGKQLLTALTGTYHPATTRNLCKAFFAYPLVTLVAVGRIHWQALKIMAKGIKYIAKPEQKQPKITTTPLAAPQDYTDLMNP